jgi:hypothetical protein
MKIELDLKGISDDTECYLRWVATAILVILWTWFLYIIASAIGISEKSVPGFASFLSFASFVIVWIVGIYPILHKIIGKYW